MKGKNMTQVKTVDKTEQEKIDDGRGHFIASYDHEENEVNVNGNTYYVYRSN